MASTEPVKRLTPQEILAKVDSQFEKARESGDLLFFPSTVYKHTDIGVDVRSLLPSSFHDSQSQLPPRFCRIPAAGADCFSLAVCDHFVSRVAEKAGGAGNRSRPGRFSSVDSKCRRVLRWCSEEGPFLASVHQGIVLGTPHARGRYRRRVRCLGEEFLFMSQSLELISYCAAEQILRCPEPLPPCYKG